MNGNTCTYKKYNVYKAHDSPYCLSAGVCSRQTFRVCTGIIPCCSCGNVVTCSMPACL